MKKFRNLVAIALMLMVATAFTVPAMTSDVSAACKHAKCKVTYSKYNGTYHHKTTICKKCNKVVKRVKEKHSYPNKWKKGTRYVGPGGVYYQEYYRYCSKCGYYQVKKEKCK